MPENVLAENIIDMADYITTEDQLAVVRYTSTLLFPYCLLHFSCYYS